jgi:hypothetical protein
MRFEINYHKLPSTFSQTQIPQKYNNHNITAFYGFNFANDGTGQPDNFTALRS